MTQYEMMEAAVNEVVVRLEQDRKRLLQARNLAVEAEADLVSMATVYSGISTDIDALLIAEPGDVGLQSLKAKKDRLLARRIDLKDEATAIKNAIDSV